MDLLFQKLQRFFEEHALECYLVGGSLRDVLLGQHPQDIDLVVRGNPEQPARALADELKGKYIALSLEKGVKRILLPKRPYGRLIIDIAPLHGEHIADDLSQRDFTVNALALPVTAVPTLAALHPQYDEQPAPLIDPCNGWRDLRARTLRAVQASVFQHDPLRLLRAIRLSAQHQLSIEPATSGLLHRDAPLLIQTAPARIRDELLQMMSLSHAIQAVRMLDEYRLFPAILPGCYSPGSPAILHTSIFHASHPGTSAWPILTCMTKLLSAAQGEIAFLNQPEQQMLAPILQLSSRPAFKKRWKKSPGGVHARSALLLLAALLVDLLQDGQETSEPHLNGGASDTRLSAQLQAIAADLKWLTLGRQAVAFIIFLLREQSSLWQMAPRPQPANGKPWIAARHYFEQFGERGVDLAAFHLACQMAASQGVSSGDAWQPEARLCIDLIEAYHHERSALIPPPLIDGQTITARLGFTKGPLIGRLLAAVRSAQLDGLIRTRAEALQFLTEEASLAGRGSAQQEKPAHQPAYRQA